MAAPTCEFIWPKGLLDDLGCPCVTPMTLFYDNEVAIHFVANLVYQEMTKHIEVDCHYIR